MIRGLTQSGSAWWAAVIQVVCTPTHEAPPRTSRPATTHTLDATARPSSMAANIAEPTKPNWLTVSRARSGVSTTVPPTAPMPTAPKSRPNPWDAKPSRWWTTRGSSAQSAAEGSPNRHRRRSSLRVHGEWRVNLKPPLIDCTRVSPGRGRERASGRDARNADGAQGEEDCGDDEGRGRAQQGQAKPTGDGPDCSRQVEGGPVHEGRGANGSPVHQTGNLGLPGDGERDQATTDPDHRQQHQPEAVGTCRGKEGRAAARECGQGRGGGHHADRRESTGQGADREAEQEERQAHGRGHGGHLGRGSPGLGHDPLGRHHVHPDADGIGQLDHDEHAEANEAQTPGTARERRRGWSNAPGPRPRVRPVGQGCRDEGRGMSISLAR